MMLKRSTSDEKQVYPKKYRNKFLKLRMMGGKNVKSPLKTGFWG